MNLHGWDCFSNLKYLVNAQANNVMLANNPFLASRISARRFHDRNPARRPGGFEIRRKKMFDHLKPGDL